MAYQLKYYKELVSQGHTWRLEIYQDTDESLHSVEIGPVLQGLRLIMQGDQADIDTPIVKTSLEMTFVDAPDLEDERKCGYWEEFYTSSATEYRVRLMKNGAVEWTGYVTPDSFTESLQYRGSVTIIARDNLGSLQDYMFNAIADDSGLISLLRLVYEGLDTVHYGMDLLIPPGAKIPYTEETNGHSLDDILFNYISFKGKTWQEAVEQTLFAAGMVLRYIGKNTLMLVALRDLPLLSQQYHFDVPILNATFCAYATRELSPAAKSIKDEVVFEIADKLIYIDSDIDSYGETSLLKSYDKFENSIGVSNEVPVYGYNVIGYGMAGSQAQFSRLLNPFVYRIDYDHSSQEWGSLQSTNVLYILCNTFNESGNGKLVETNPFKCAIRIQQPGSFNVQYKFAHPVALYNNRSAIGNYANMDGYAPSFAEEFDFRAKWEGDDGQVLYLKTDVAVGQSMKTYWDENEPANLARIMPVNFANGYECEAFPELVTTSAGVLTIEFYGAVIDYTTSRIPGSEGVYIRLTDIIVEDVSAKEESYLLEQLRINTIYNKNNNIILSRNPEYANNPSKILSPSKITNGIYVLSPNKEYRGSEFWQFGPNDAKQPLSVLIHQQLLAYYSKPNNVLTGELATDNPLFNALYAWNGKAHLLTSGALNVITGRMENVVLREFARYDHMWETWVENEDVDKDYPGGVVLLRVHSAKKLTEADITGIPLWLSFNRIQQLQNRLVISLRCMENASGADRQAIIRVDTACVRITQRAAGDYGIDYGKDYS